jgi:hypothetical protein
VFAWSQLDFFAIPISISSVSLTSRQTWQNVKSKRRLQKIQNVQEGKRHYKKRHLVSFVLVPSDFSEKFPTTDFGIISAETSLWEIERKLPKIFYEDFYLPLYLPLCLVSSLLLNKSKRTRG